MSVLKRNGRNGIVGVALAPHPSRTRLALRLLGVMCPAMFIATQAMAAGGSGAPVTPCHGFSGGAPGADSVTGQGMAGSLGVDQCETGGGGGGAGITGGNGGNGGTNLGGAGGTPGGAGLAGQNDTSGLGGGGGGGGGAAISGTQLPTTDVTGGAGGAGGNGVGGGGGGAGGYGVIFSGTGNQGTLSTNITGGAGGRGGQSSSAMAQGGEGGSGGTGLYAVTSFGLTTTGTITGGEAGPGGSGGLGSGFGGAGGDAVHLNAGGSLVNGGTLRGGLGGSGLRGGAGGNGLSGTGFSFSNLGQVDGGTGGSSTASLGGFGGTGILATNANIINFGKISGGAEGINGDGGGGEAIDATNSIVENLGNISGGLNTDGTRTSAISFSGNNNNLIVFAGSTITGKVVVLGNTGLQLFTLGGNGNGSFDISTIGSQYQGFNSFQKTGSSTWTLTGTTSTSIIWQIDQGTLAVTSDANLGAQGSILLGNGTLQFLGSTTSTREMSLNGNSTIGVANGSSVTLSGNIAGGGSLTVAGGGELTLAGTDTYSGPTNVVSSVLNVTGQLKDTSEIDVGTNSTLLGTGVVTSAVIANGAGLVAGNETAGSQMTFLKNLTFQSGATYRVDVSPTASSFAGVLGTATLGGATVEAVFANGSYVAKQYTILRATGGVSGTFASTVTNVGLPSNFSTSLSYDGTDAFLNLSLSLTPNGTHLNTNQAAVGNLIQNAFNTSGIPLAFGALTPSGLSQASGENATGSQQASFTAMTTFMNIMTDPSIADRGATSTAANNATGYADEAMGYSAAHRGRSNSERDAYAAMYGKAPVAPTFEQRWSVWASGFGGSQTTSGDPTVGSSNTSSSIAGTAVGADYRFSPDTLAGFALAGGGTSFSVNGMGWGRSDLFQAGAFVRQNFGAAYLTGALAYGWQDVTTDRIVAIAGIDHLRAQFDANTWSGRVEGGYRFVAPVAGNFGITPYAAAQVTAFDLPAYAESVVSGASTFALSYAAKDVTDTRSELGIRTDKSIALTDGILTLRSRFAWAHDFNPDRSVSATFQALPGGSFVVNGAALASESALTTASLEMKWANGWSVVTTFEGEFSSVTESYAGKGTVRYAW
jgi:uncharacterized protein with beta-barrel porin domain